MSLEAPKNVSKSARHDIVLDPIPSSHLQLVRTVDILPPIASSDQPNTSFRN